MSSLPALATNPKIILFTDWDGTVTMEDSNDHLTDSFGMGVEKRRALNVQIINGETTFREAFHQMMESVHKPFDECLEVLLKDIKLDPGFADFYKWSVAHNVPVVVVSSGMEPIIRALLGKLVGEHAKDIQIISNSVDLVDGGKEWHLVYRDESDFGHDKSRAIKPYAALPKTDRPILLYAGDGVSDLSAAKETDLLFAKEGRDLVTWCKKEDVPFTEFHSYKDIHKHIEDLWEGKTSIAQLRE